MSCRSVFLSVGLLGCSVASYGQNSSLATAGPNDAEPQLAVIAGKVLSAETGVGLPKATVALYSADNRRSQRPLAAKTNDKGEYQLLGVPPGRYRIFASRNGYVRQSFSRDPSQGRVSGGTPVALGPGQVLRDVDFHLTPAGVIEGRIFAEDYEPASRVNVSLSRVRTIRGKRTLTPVANARTDDRGIYRLFGIPPGGYYLSATYRPFEMPRGQAATPVVTYYPGVLTPQEATRVDVPPGARFTGADLVLREARSYTVRGAVVGAGDSSVAAVRIYCRQRSSEGWASEAAGRATTDRAGNFEVINLIPGEYLLSAYANQSGRALMGMASLSVRGEDVEHVVLALGDGSEIQGRVSLEDSDQELDPSRISVHVVPEEVIPPVFLERIADVNENGTFQLTQVPPGSARMAVDLPPGNFFVESIRLGGMEIADRPFTVGADQQITGLRVVVSSEGAQFGGGVWDDDTGDPASGATVILYSTDRNKRTVGSRFTKITQTDQEGRFSLGGIVPGKYVVCALKGHESGAETDPSLLDKVAESCERTELAPNENATNELAAIPAPPHD